MEQGSFTVHDHLLYPQVRMDRYIFDTVWDRIWGARNNDGVSRTNEGRGYIQQDKEELWQLMEYLIRLQPQRILEIGNACGGTALFWQALAPTVVSLGMLPIEGHIPPDYFPNVHFLVADSHTPEAVQQAAVYAPYDFLFIDGDHSTDGVRMDYEMYSPLVRQGGIVGFHDYNHSPVRTFLEKVPNLTIMPRNYYGIGVMYK